MIIIMMIIIVKALIMMMPIIILAIVIMMMVIMDRMMMTMFTWGQDSTTSLKEVSSTCGQSDKSKYYKKVLNYFIEIKEP